MSCAKHICKHLDYAYVSVENRTMLSLVCYRLIWKMTHTFLLAPPSDTLGLVLKSPSKLNIVRFFPLTDSEVATNIWKRKQNENYINVLI